MTAATHVPVMVAETIDALAPTAGASLFDGTLGRGGHALAWLEATTRLGATGRVVGTDRDAVALAEAASRVESSFPGRLAVHHGSFEDAGRAVAGAGLAAVDAALLDLGMSSPQVDDASRGFSFEKPGPLDMRMDPAPGTPTAADIVNSRTIPELAEIFREFGEEPAADRIARAVAIERARAPYRDTLRLAETVARAVGGRRGRLHPATRVFQALRIAVNDELGRLDRGLPAVASTVREGGRFAVISFHRLEDGRVKDYFDGGASRGEFREVTVASPTGGEVASNPRSRSARLRAVEVVRRTGKAAR